ncbi:MAG TPA: signal recognition particle-docking protein FtsY [Limnochordia bacterium]|nr:signal recognition particle-docking protein FtsY [Limnochordia bacterium]
MSEGRKSWLGRLKEGLTKTRASLVGKVKEVLVRGGQVDEALFEELEEVLIQADVGVETSLELIEEVRQKVRERRIREAQDVQPLLAEGMKALLKGAPLALKPAAPASPLTYIVVGVNGAGKTTTVGKLAARFVREGRKVLIGAGDTFRAAAIDQLKVWAERAGADIIAQQPGSDPAAVAYDAVQAAKARGTDVLILDTAGRLQTKVNLMQELGKVYRVVTRELGREPDESLLVIDGTTGQNALSQGRIFSETVPLTGVVLTKLDGTAKGGVVLSVSRELGLPVKLIGIGEGIDDLREFDPDAFVDALFAQDDNASSRL